MSKVEHDPAGQLTQEQAPIRLLQSEAQAIAVAKEIALEIAEIAADASQNGQLPRRQAQLLSESAANSQLSAQCQSARCWVKNKMGPVRRSSD